jgi:predicted esterase
MPDFVYSHIPGDGAAGVTLVLLHGTGGDENDLLPLGKMLLPGATLVSPRGKVLEGGMPRYFRRLRENVFDLLDLRFRTNELADFLARFEGPLIAVGYSNGANIAASTLLLRPEIFAGAVLLRARVPIEPDLAPDLSGKPVLVSGGRRDLIISPEGAVELARTLRGYEAEVTLNQENAGHELTAHELELAREWVGKVATDLRDRAVVTR